MVDCRRCAYPNTHLFVALTLKITVGCPSSTYPSFLAKKNVHTSWTPWSALQQSGELWARALVPSQANHSNDGKHSKTRFLSVAVREPGNCGQDMGTRRSWSRFPHDERDTALNSQVRQRTFTATRSTIGDRRRYGVSTEQTVAMGGCTTRRQRIARTATMDVIDPPQGLRQRAQPIREPFQSGTDATKGMTALQ